MFMYLMLTFIDKDKFGLILVDRLNSVSFVHILTYILCEAMQVLVGLMIMIVDFIEWIRKGSKIGKE